MSASIERPLGGTEKLFWHNDRAGGFRIVAWVAPPARPDLDALGRAVADLAASHGALRVRVAREGVHALVFREIDRPIPLRVDGDLTFADALEDELSTPLPEEGPLARARWVEQSGVLMLTVHHAVSDGRSALRLLAQVLGLADAPQGPDVQLPAVESWFPASVRGMGGLFRLFGALREIGSKGRPVRLPGDAGPRTFGFVHRVLPSSAFRRLAPAAGGPGVFDGLCAASLLAAWDDLGATGPVVMTAGCPVDLRDRLPEGSADRAGLVIASLPLTVQVDGSRPLEALAAEIARCRQDAIEREHHFALSRFLSVQAWLTDWMAVGASGVQRAARFIESAGVPTLAVSNIGRLPWAEACGSTGAVSGLGATADLTVFATTAGPHTTLSVVHAMPRIDRERAARFLDRVVERAGVGA